MVFLKLMETNEYYMNLAYLEAVEASKMNEVPVGAVIVSPTGEVLSKAHNLKETLKDVTAHAEILAIKEASEKLNNWRLNGCKIYVTLEPCLMCTSAIFQARISEVYVGVLRTTDDELTMSFFKDYMFDNNIGFKVGIDSERIKNLLENNFKKIR